MFSSISKNKFLPIIFWLFVAGYATLFLIKPTLGPTDDLVFLRTLQSGKPLIYFSPSFPYYDWLNLGRFSLLTSMEYNLVGLFSNSPFWYFFYHAVQFVIFALILVKLLGKITPNKSLIYGISALVFLLPGFTISWFRLQLPERNVIFLLALLFLIYLKFLEKQKFSFLLAGLIVANLAIYYKEVIFVSLGVFSFTHLILGWKQLTRKIKLFDGLLLFSSAFYFTIYYFYIYLHSSPFFLRARTYDRLIAFLKNILNYTFFSDPILILLLPLALYRLYKIFVKKESPEPFFDALIASASVCALSVFALNIYSPYYLIPIYVMAILPLVHYLKEYLAQSIAWKFLFGLMIFVVIVNVIPSGIHYLTFNKYLPINFNKTLDFLIGDIAKKHSGQQANIFLDGIDLAAGRGAYFIFGEFLQYKGLNPQKFDLKSSVFTKYPEPLVSKISPPFTVFNSDTPSEIKSGDYLIITPQKTTQTTTQDLQSLKDGYQLLYQTKSPLAFPSLTLKSIVKWFILEKISKTPKEKGLIMSENFWEKPDYYVFVKK